MSPAWSDNLDMLALNGVLDFDAPSYVTGQNPRYVGSIEYTPSPFAGPKPETKNLQQPQIDEFRYNKSNKNDKFSVPAWKKWLFGGLAAGTLIFGGWKFQSKWLPHMTNLPKKFKSEWLPKIKNLPDKLKLDKIGNFFKNGWNKLFHRKKS